MAPKKGTNRLFPELTLPPGADGEAEAGRVVSLGATRTGTGDGVRTMMLDPDGNEFSPHRLG